MAENIVEVIIKAIDATSGVIKGVEGSYAKLNDTFKQVTGVSLTAAGGIALATKALQASIQYVKQAIDEEDKYVSSIVSRSKVMKESLEETSRLYQAADDVFLKSETLEQSLLAAKRKGYDVSVQGLQNLSEQYLATGQDSKFLTDTFGRNGAEMYKLMMLGRDGIRAQMDAVSSSLVVTTKSKQITYEYKQSVDALNDSFDGIKYTVAQETMPLLTDLNTIMAWAIEKSQTLSVKNKGLSETLLALSGPLYPLIKYYELLVLGIDKAANSINNITPAMAESSRWMEIYKQYLQEVSDEQANAAESLITLQTEYQNVSTLAQGLTSSEKDLKAAEQDVAEYIKNNPWDTKGIQSRKDKVNELKEAQQTMVNQWMLNVYTQMLTADKDMSLSDMQFLLNFQVNTGLITQAAADRAMGYWNSANQMINGNDSVKASNDSLISNIVAMQGPIDALHGTSIDIVTNHIDNYITNGVSAGNVWNGQTGPGAGVQGATTTPKSVTSKNAIVTVIPKRASGGPVTAGMPYLVGEQGPEPFIPSTNGTVLPNKSLGGISESQLTALLIAMKPDWGQVGREFASALIGAGYVVR